MKIIEQAAGRRSCSEKMNWSGLRRAQTASMENLRQENRMTKTARRAASTPGKPIVGKFGTVAPSLTSATAKAKARLKKYPLLVAHARVMGYSEEYTEERLSAAITGKAPTDTIGPSQFANGKWDKLDESYDKKDAAMIQAEAEYIRSL